MQYPEQRKSLPPYEALRLRLEEFLPSVGERVLALRAKAEQDPDFAKMKADKSIVTKADELAETLIRAWVSERFPNDSIRGEEQEDKVGGGRTWIVDPIDGTYNFTHTGDKFGISVGVYEGNAAKLGVIFYPVEQVMLSASYGAGARLNGESLAIGKGNEDIDKALIIGEWHPLHQKDPHFTITGPQTEKLLATVTHHDIGWSATNTFREMLHGTEDVFLYPGLTPYDIGAMVCIAQELGMSVSGYDGAPVNLNQERVPIVISRNQKLHQSIIERLNS